MHGIGNDFVVVDARSQSYPDTADLARQACDRRTGVGADGLILVENGRLAPVRMRMLNPDGSESEMCGNGLRCVAKWLDDQASHPENSRSIETGGRTAEAMRLEDGRIRVDMGVVEIVDRSRTAGGYAGVFLSVGNPHFVVFVPEVTSVDLESVGPALEHDPAFPDRTNVHFVQVLDRGAVKQRTWERGAGITLACGSGACAGAFAAQAEGRTDATVRVDLPGGSLTVESTPSGRVWMTGPAETVFTGWLRKA